MTGVVAIVATGAGTRVEIVPPSAVGSGSGGGFLLRINTNAVTAVITPPAYNSISWVYVSGDAFVVNSPTSITTSFGYDLEVGQTTSGFYVARVVVGTASYDSAPFLVQCTRV